MLLGPCLLAGVGIVGLVLAVMGAYSTAAALVVGSILAVGGLWLARGRADERAPAPSSWPAVAACALALGFVVWAGWSPSQHLLINQDPGGYTETARWLVRDGSLEVDAAQGGLSGDPAVRFESNAAYDMGGGRLEFQFNHLTSVILAAAYDVGGYRLMFRMPALIGGVGLLCVYAVAVAATGRARLSLLAPGALALSAPFLYVTTDTFSEPLTMALLWAAMFALLLAHRRPSVAIGALGGFLLGAITATRVDATLYVALAVPLCAASLLASPDRAVRRARTAAFGAAALAALVTGLVGWVDLNWWSGHYVQHLHDEVASLRLLLVVSVVVSALGAAAWCLLPALRKAGARLADRGAAVAAAVVALVLLAAWLVRPRVQVTHGPTVIPILEGIQARDGLAVDGTRRYAEDSLRWMGWYLGRVGLAAAIGGLAVATYQTAKGRARPAVVALLVLTLASGALYWSDPRITPYQLWAIRRFVPAVLPGLAVMAVVFAAWVLGGSAGRRWTRTAAVGLLAAAMLVGPATVTWKLRGMRAQPGAVDVVAQACELIGPDAAVLVTGASAQGSLPQALRGWCGVPTGSLVAAASPDDLADIGSQVAGEGRRLLLVSTDPASFEPYAALLAPVDSTTTSRSDHEPRQSVDRAPGSFEPAQGLTLHVAEVSGGPDGQA